MLFQASTEGFFQVAMKLESTKSKHPVLRREANLYKVLQDTVGIPHLRRYGTEVRRRCCE